MQCPDCGATVRGVETRAPGAHAFDPCGCSATALTAADFAAPDRGRGLATDGGTTTAETTATNHSTGRCRAISQNANRRCRNSGGHGPRGTLCAIHANETDPVTIDSDPRTLVKAVSPENPARCRAIQYDGERCPTGCGPTDRFCALHKTISLPEVIEFLGDGELNTALIKRALSAVEQTDQPRTMTDGGVADSTESPPVSVRVEISDEEVTWHTSETAYERLHNHPTGNLVADIEDDVADRDGSLFDVVVAPSGAFWVMEVES